MDGPDKSLAGTLISVVTPFYNTAAYLAECIESVLGQTFADFEYILLDNCSTDGSTDIALGYAARDARVKYVKGETFVGQVPNYNRALRQISARSRYCKMVQADDWLFPTCLATMVQLAEAHPGIAVVGSYSLYGDRVGHGSLPFRPSSVFPGREAIGFYLMADRGFLGSPTCVMFRSDLVRARDPFFPLDCPDFEDAAACFELLRRGDFGFVYQVLTCNRRDNESIWTGIDRLNPIALHNLLLLARYGPEALDAGLFRERWSSVLGEYYAWLAGAALRPYDRELWDYHRQGLASQGLAIDRMLLARHIAAKIVDILGNPKATLARIIRRMRSG